MCFRFIYKGVLHILPYIYTQKEIDSEMVSLFVNKLQRGCDVQQLKE